MNENLQRLETKVENQGSTPQGKVSAAEWNILVAAVKALDVAGIDTETLAKYLKQYQYITSPELDELLKDVTENIDGVVDLKSAQTIEGLKDFINGFKIGGALVKYDPAKKCFIFTENVLMEKGLAWNSRFGDFTDEEIFSITKAVDVDWETIGKNASGQLYVISGGGEGGGGNCDPDFLHNYLNNNIGNYALPITGGTVNGNITATKFIGALEGSAESATKLSTIGLFPESMDRGTIAYSRFDYPENVVGLPIADNANGVLTINTHAGLYNHQLGFSTSGFFYRKVYDRGINTSGDWKEVAFTDSNVASANKLATSRTIWGQSFDGTSDVSGSIMSVNILRYINGGSGIFLRGSLFSSQLSNSDIGFEAEIAAFSGKVAIGGSVANEALHVHGNILATGNVSAQNVIINGKAISYNADKNAFVLPANLLVEGGIAWNSRFEDFTEDEIFTITKAVNIDGTSIIRDGGVLRVNPDYIQSVGGLNENELANYLTNNKYITESALSPYAKTENVNSVLTDYVDKTSIKKYMGWSQAHHIEQDIDRLYNFGVVSTAGNVNAPSTAAYGIVATFPYRNAYGNSIPDLAAQLYFPNGDEATPHLFWRSSIKNAWNNWRTILDSSNYSNYALPITGGTVSGNVTLDRLYTTEGVVLTNTGDSFSGLIPNSRITSSGQNEDFWLYNTNGAVNHYATSYAFNRGDALFQGSITAPKFIGALEGNADSATKLSTIGLLYESIDRGTIAYSRFDYPENAVGLPIADNANGVLTINTHAGLYNHQLGFSTSGFFYRKVYDRGINTSGDWKEVAFVQGDSLDPASGVLTVNGNILATGRIAWNSSRVLKTEIKEHYLSLEDMAQIKPYRYKWKDGRDDLVHVGAIADEVMEPLPETVLTDALGIHSMDYAQTAFIMGASLTPYVDKHERELIECKKTIKEQGETIIAQAKRIKALEIELKTLKRVA